jgi:thiol-disulfide isomerase/thioredoxin
MDETRKEALRQRAREVVAQNAQAGVPAPLFGADKEWLNVSRTLASERDLAGKLVLLDFWTYCCINCMHVLPDLAWLEERFAGEPFTVVGVHSAKFANERDVQRVREAVLREGIAHPVVVDRDFDIWKRFGVRAWPTLVLVGPDGRMLGQVSGEGQRAVLDALIEAALELYHAIPGAFDATPLPLRLERERALPRELRFPGKLLADAALARLWVADSGNHRVLELDLDGKFLRQFGSGTAGFEDGEAADAMLRGPQGLARIENALYVADTLNHALRKIDLRTGSIETVAGNGRQGYERGRTLPARGAALNSPWDLRVVGDELWIAMAGLHQVWSYDPRSGSVRPLAGDGSEQRRDGAFELAALAQPSGLARLGSRVLLADSESSSVRVLDLDTRRVSTLAGGAEDPRNLFHFGDEEGAGFGRRFQHPLAIECAPDGDPERALVYVADTYNHQVKLLDPETGTVSRYAGASSAGLVDGECEGARFCEPGGLSLAGDTLFVADTNNHCVRAIDLVEHTVRTLALEGVPITLPREARSIGAEELPHLPQTIAHPQVRRRLPTGACELVLRVPLAEGESLASGAPSQFRAMREGGLVAAKLVTGPLESAETRIPLGVAGPGLVRVQALVYVCGADGACRLRSHDWRIDIEENERAPRVLALDIE